MAQGTAHDLDFLAARLHGRRARLADAERLEALCRLRTLPELARAVYPGGVYRSCEALQRRLLEDLVLELTFAASYLEAAGRELLKLMRARFQLENLKLVLRGFVNQLPLERVTAHLLVLPEALALDVRRLLNAGSLEALAARLPAGAPRRALESALHTWRDPPPLFFLEAALDRAHLEALLALSGRLRGGDREVVSPIFDQEACAFLLLLAVRGRFLHGVAPELLWPLQLRARCGLSGGRFKAMTAAPDLRAAASLALARAIDALPGGEARGQTSLEAVIGELEALAWERSLRLCSRALRRSHLGLGAIVGYAGLRRVEAVNLITLSEGVRGGVAPEAIRARLIPRVRGTAHV